MASTDQSGQPTSQTQGVDMKLEVVTLPVSDVDRVKSFYQNLGWRLDADFVLGDDIRAVQLTPPHSECSIAFGKGLTTAEPGSAQRLELVVANIDAAREDLIRRGVEVSEVFHGAGDMHAGADEPFLSGSRRVTGADPERGSYRSFASFRDPDGNGWLIQEITTRLPGRVEGETAFTSPVDLASALRRAAAAHGEHEKRSGGQHDANWPDWYAEYIVREQAGRPLP